MALNGNTNEERIWNYLKAAGLNDYGTAGLMGNLYAESALNPKNLQGSYEKKLGFTDESYTAAVDSGSYGNFVKDAAGYGLAQWTYWSRKEKLLNFVKALGVSIGDLEAQLAFLCKELESYVAVLSVLKTATSVRQASDIVLTKYERPANQGAGVQEKRAAYGQKYFDKYAGAPAAPAMPTKGEDTSMGKCYASKVLAVAAGEIGYHEKKSNAQLDDKTANSGSANYTKYARDFDQKFPKWYNGKKNGFAWCDMFVDWCFLTAFGYDDALRLLCQPERSAGAGCTYSLRYFKNKGRFHTSNPKPGDQIFFGTSLDNSTHTGIVEKVDSSKVYTIEGNTSDQVARRSYALSASKILGYGRPDFDAETGSAAALTTPTTPAPEQTTPSTPATDVSGLKVGDEVKFIGHTHYASANASSGPSASPCTAKVTALYKTGKHPVHIVGSGVYGWVDVADIEGASTGSTGSTEIKVGDVVQFKGGPHYKSAKGNTTPGSPKPGPAKVTAISKGAAHPYHLIHTTKESTVYGWVDADKVTK